jgi:hypothetical protein
MLHRIKRSLFFLALSLMMMASFSLAQGCPEEPAFQNYTGAGSSACPCFVAGEEAGAVFQIPAEHYPIEILRVGVGWGSLFGGNPTQFEQAVHIYNGQLPNPGARIHTVTGPLLSDGVINEFDLEPEIGEIIVTSGPVAVTLEFLNNNAGNSYAPTLVHDGNGCQSGLNLVKAIPGGWSDACALGVTGDWVFHLVYRQVGCVSDVPREYTVGNGTATLHPCYPNPFNPSTTIAYDMASSGNVRLAVFGQDGRKVAELENGFVEAGNHRVVWQGRDDAGRMVPSGVYFYQLEGPGFRETRQMVLLK